MKIKVKSLGVVERKGYCFLNVMTQYADTLSGFVPKEHVDFARKAYPIDKIFVAEVVPVIRNGQPSLSLKVDYPASEPIF